MTNTGLSIALKTLFSITFLALVGACSGGPSDSAFRGIYQISGWTETTDGCDSEAESKLEQELQSGALVLIDDCKFSFPGVTSESWLQITQCSDLADCEEQRCTGNELPFAMGDFSVLLDGNDEDGWTNNDPGYSVYKSFEGDACTLVVSDPLLFMSEDGILTFEKQTLEGSYDPINGKCTPTSFVDGEWVDNFDDEKLHPIAKDVQKNGNCTDLMRVTLTPVSENP